MMKINVLIENTSKSDLKAEHGLSLLIEFQGKRYLLDAGSTDQFLENAVRSDFSVFDVEACILSHGHYDHSGGFGTYLEQNRNVHVYMMEAAAGEYYSGSGGKIHRIGIPEEVIKKHRERFVLIQKKTQISENIYLVPHNTKGLDNIGEKAKLYRKEGEQYLPDDFAHELSLVFDTEQGLVIFNSCSHGGAQNIIREVMETFPGKSIYAYIGGLHMKGTKDGEEICTFPEKNIENLSEYLKKCDLKYLYTGHCTGRIGFELLKKYMGESVRALWTGQEILL